MKEEMRKQKKKRNERQTMKWIIDDGLINQTFLLGPQSLDKQFDWFFLYVRQDFFFFLFTPPKTSYQKMRNYASLKQKNTQWKITLINIKKYPLLWTDCVNNVMDTSSVSTMVLCCSTEILWYWNICLYRAMFIYYLTNVQ